MQLGEPVSSDCCNKLTLSRWLQRHRHKAGLLAVLEACSPTSRSGRMKVHPVPKEGFYCVFSWWRNDELSATSACKNINPVKSGPVPMLHLLISLASPSPNTATLGIRTTTYEWDGSILP